MKAIKLSYEAINAIVTSIIKYKEANFSFDEEKQVLTLNTDPEKEKYTENEISLFHNFVFLKEVKIKVLEDQPAIVNNGDSKKAILNYNGNKIELTCTLSNTKDCKWDIKYPESHDHYIIKFKFGKNSGKFDFFDSLHNFETGQTDKTEIDIFEMFYMFLSDCQIAKDYTFEEYQIEFEGAKSGYTACERALKKFERVFSVSGIDLSDLANYMQEKYVF
jgi:hypothetical protein